MIRYFLEKYYKKTKGYYPFFKYCPNFYKDFFLEKRFFDSVGYFPCFDNPKTFNEKLRWLILNEKTELKTKLTDKLQAKKWCQEKLGNDLCAELYGEWKKFDDIDFNALPDKFALKVNHGWKMNLLILNKAEFIRTKKNQTRKMINEYLKINYYDFSLEPQYINIERKVFAEKLRSIDSSSVQEYQVHCMNGEPKLIEVSPSKMFSIFFKNPCIQFYDLNWTLQPYTYYWKYNNKQVEKPDFFNDLLKYSKKLAEGFSYVRVDFAIDEGNIVN